jgi:transketolase C-terminal domain/subunit
VLWQAGAAALRKMHRILKQRNDPITMISGSVLTLENGRVTAGFGSAVCECLSKEYPVRVDRMGIGEEPSASANLGALLAHHGLTPPHVARRVKELIAKS